tara:strand:+ start:1101 stop:1217 length:117 start_codon:yes stop_codon:yes gene_type:complete
VQVVAVAVPLEMAVERGVLAEEVLAELITEVQPLLQEQ